MDGLFYLLMADIDLTPTDEMATEAQRGLDWRSEFGRGGTAVGIARARDIANKKNLSPDTIGRMVSFFARHEVDKQAQGFRPSEDGYPSNGRIAWALWGGDPGQTWAKSKQRQLQKSEDVPMEHKQFPAIVLSTDEDQGIVEHIVAVMGVIDLGDDRIHNGAFTKTLAERGGKVRVLDQHKTDSVLRIIGKPLEMRELRRDELPASLLAQYPEATGALYCKTQFLMNTPEGKGAFERIKTGALEEWSFGYDALDKDYENVSEGRSVRNLRTLKLFEYSPVIWGMNPATMTLGAKEMGEEMKPYQAIMEDGAWRVYKLDADGEPTGEPLGEHESEDEAQAQIAALYAAEGKPKKEDMPERMETKQEYENGLSVMVAFYPPVETAVQLAESYPGGLLAPDIHLTLCYLGNAVQDNLDKAEVVQQLGAFANTCGIDQVSGAINGYARFENGSEHALVAIYDSPEIAMFRMHLVDALGNKNYKNHGFVPHLTLGYLDPQAQTPTLEVPKVKIIFDTLYLIWGTERIPFKFGYPGGGHGAYAKAAHNSTDTPKAGRVLSRRNGERILTAVQMLREALAEAGIEWSMDEEEDEETQPEEMMADTADNEQKAGPPPEAPTPDSKMSESERMLQLIDIELLELEV
jgi:HK97 family phage prohead protease